MLDKNKLCENFNKFRLENSEKYFSLEEMKNNLKKLGFNKHIIQLLIKDDQLFTRLSRWRDTKIRFSTKPLYIEKLKNLYCSYNKSSKTYNCSIERAIKLLKNNGYKVLKKEGFDLNTFKSENPDLYNKYQIEKEV